MGWVLRCIMRCARTPKLGPWEPSIRIGWILFSQIGGAETNDRPVDLSSQQWRSASNIAPMKLARPRGHPFLLHPLHDHHILVLFLFASEAFSLVPLGCHVVVPRRLPARGFSKGDATSGPMFPAQRRSNEGKTQNNDNHLIMTRHHKLRELSADRRAIKQRNVNGIAFLRSPPTLTCMI